MLARLATKRRAQRRVRMVGRGHSEFFWAASQVFYAGMGALEVACGFGVAAKWALLVVLLGPPI